MRPGRGAARLLVLPLVLVGFLWLASPTEGSSGLPVTRPGDRGPAVVLVQDLLHRLGLYDGEPDGLFGPQTTRAVKEFQRGVGLGVDGVVGAATWEGLRRATASLNHDPEIHRVRPGETLWEIARRYGTTVRALAAANGLGDPNRIREGTRLLIPPPNAPGAGRPDLALWNEANALFPRGEVARVIDVRTGKSFQIRRFAGYLHADVEPLSETDTRTMREIYGGRWSWERRAIIVEVRGRRFAASMNGQPHGQGAVANNRFPGHFCIHFLGSRTHGTRRMDFEHHRRVMEAAGYPMKPGWLLI